MTVPNTNDLPYLIRLLDDDDPSVSPVVSQQLRKFGGDISQDIAALGIDVSRGRKKRLSSLLAEGRRQTLADEWIVPSRGVASWEDDWESFEHTLRLLSDFLHDGVTMRSALPDLLDLLADEVRQDLPEPSAAELRDWLFSSGRYCGDKKKADACNYFDLCHVIDVRQGNPTSLACLFMLLGRRLGVSVEGCNYPAHFLARIQVEGKTSLVDCFHHGRTFDVESLLKVHPKISEKARAAVLSQGHLGVILHRYVSEIRNSLLANEHDVAGKFFAQLADSLEQ